MNDLDYTGVDTPCPRCKWPTNYRYYCTVRLGDPDPGYVRCENCLHMWVGFPPEPQGIVLTDDKGNIK